MLLLMAATAKSTSPTDPRISSNRCSSWPRLTNHLHFSIEGTTAHFSCGNSKHHFEAAAPSSPGKAQCPTMWSCAFQAHRGKNNSCKGIRILTRKREHDKSG